MNVVKMVVQYIIYGVAMRIRESQNLQKLDTNPTHTQIAKDDMEHPLHLLAGNLARIAVADLGRQYYYLKKGTITINDYTQLAREYLSHPADVDWMNVTIMKWASTHIGSVQNAQNKGFLDKLQKEHHHHIEHTNHSQHKFLENISDQLSELKKFYEKAKEMEEDLEVSESIEKTIEYVKQKFTF